MKYYSKLDNMLIINDLNYNKLGKLTYLLLLRFLFIFLKKYFNGYLNINSIFNK